MSDINNNREDLKQNLTLEENEKTLFLTTDISPGKTVDISGTEDAVPTMAYTCLTLTGEELLERERLVSQEWQSGDLIIDLYEVKEVLGEGAYGTVYKVLHRNWNTFLAVKSLRPELSADEKYKNSFVRECQGWVNLALHPNIVSCYYVRDLGGLPRIFLEYIEGGNLFHKISKGELTDLKEILNLSVQCLDGLSFAHKSGLIHRDVKPHNCLLTSGGDLKITDFGIASGLATMGIRDEMPSCDTSSGKTIMGEGGAAGTPAYMPPEQWDGQRGKTGPWSDIYAFGIMLYEMCCKKRPFDDGTEPPVVLKARHLTFEPEKPEEINSKIPPSLSGFILKCLSKKPEDRFQSCDEAREEVVKIYKEVTGEIYPGSKPEEAQLIADDLNNRAVSMIDLGKTGEAESILEEALKTEPSHPQAIYNRGLLLWRTGRRTDLEIVRQLEEAKNVRPRDWTVWYLTGLVQMERGDGERAEKELERALELLRLESHSPMEPEVENMLEKAKKVSREKCGKCLNAFSGHGNWVSSVDISPDGKFLLSGSKDNTIYLWDFSSGKCTGGFKGHINWVNSVCFSSDGKSILSGSKDKTIRLWDISGGEAVKTLEGHTGGVNSVCFSPDGQFAISGSDDKTLRFWYIEGEKCLKILEGHSHSVESVALSPDGKFALSGSKDKTLRLWNISTGECIKVFSDHENTVNSVCFSPDGKFALSAGGSQMGVRDNSIRLWDMTEKKCIRTFKGHNGGVSSLSISPDGKFALSGSEDATIRMWELATGKCMRTIETENSISSLSISPDGKFAFSASRRFDSLKKEDRLLHIWKLEIKGLMSFIVVQPRTSAGAIESSQKFNKLLEDAEKLLNTGSTESAVSLAEEARKLPGYEQAKRALTLKAVAGKKGKRKGLRSGWFVRAFEGHRGRVSSLCFSGDGKTFLSGGEDKIIRLWDREKGETLKTFEGHSGKVSSLSISPDGKYILSGSEDNTIRLWHMEKGKCLQTLEGHISGVKSLCFSSSGKYALSGSWDNTLRLWNLESRKCIRLFRGHTGSVFSVSISPDDRFAISGSNDKTFRIWDIRTGKCIMTSEEHADSITSVAISPDGKYAILGCADKNLYIYDIKDGKYIKTPDNHTKAISSVCISSDGRFALSGGWDNTVRVWDLTGRNCLRTFEGHTRDVECVCMSPDGQFALSGSEDSAIRLWELDWDYDFPESAPWDEGAKTFAANFIRSREGKISGPDEEFHDFLRTLGDSGYGWIKKESAKEKFEKMKASFRPDPPIPEDNPDTLVSSILSEQQESWILEKTKGFSIKKTIAFLSLGALLIFLIAFVVVPTLRTYYEIHKQINILKQNNPVTQPAAIHELVLIGKPAVKPLIEVLKDESPGVREMAVEGLVRIGEPAVEPLIGAMKKEVLTGVKVNAADALGKIKDVRAIKVLIENLGDKNEEIRESVINALTQIGEPAVKPVIAVLGHRSADVRAGAAKVLGKINHADGAEPLISLLKDDVPAVREQAIESLASLGSHAVGPLIKALGDENKTIQENAIKALVKLDWTAYSALYEALSNPSPVIQENARKALEETWGPVNFYW